LIFWILEIRELYNKEKEKSPGPSSDFFALAYKTEGIPVSKQSEPVLLTIRAYLKKRN
jgi:hypothetical protein